MRNVSDGLLRRFVPAHIHNPFRLALRLVFTRDRAAWFSLLSVILGVLATPLDLILRVFEKQLYKRAPQPTLPVIFVCGPPRSGTTLLAQVLIKHLPVSYISNVAAVFPRSPVIANLLLKKLFGKPKITYESFYGKTFRFSGPNDGFYIWNQWMQADPSGVRCVLMESRTGDMIKFFGAYEHAFRKPLVSKNNSLVICAASVAKVLANSYFICLRRDPIYLAQSLIRARVDLHGDPSVGLWADRPDRPRDGEIDYVEDVCEQVLFYERKIREQQQLVGPERFWVVSYEEFCKAPETLLRKVSEEIMQQSFQSRDGPEPFHDTNEGRLQPEIFARIKQIFAEQKQRTVQNAPEPRLT